MVVNLWRYRGMILRNALLELRTRYAGSLGGYMWHVLVPLAQLVVFSTVFGVLMHQRLEQRHVTGLPGQLAFVIYLCSGLLPWNAFADTLMRGVGSLVGNSGYLKKLPLPEQIFLATDACTGLFSALIAMVLFGAFIVVLGYGPYLEWLQAIPALLLFMSFALGLGLFLSCLNVFFRDVQPLMNVALQLWFWLTPIVYLEEIFHASSLDWMRGLLAFNPAYHFVRCFQVSVFEHALVPAQTWALCLGFAALANAAGYLVLRKLRPEIRDAL